MKMVCVIKLLLHLLQYQISGAFVTSVQFAGRFPNTRYVCGMTLFVILSRYNNGQMACLYALSEYDQILKHQAYKSYSFIDVYISTTSLRPNISVESFMFNGMTILVYAFSSLLCHYHKVYIFCLGCYIWWLQIVLIRSLG